jgi:hypothetical protein
VLWDGSWSISAVLDLFERTEKKFGRTEAGRPGTLAATTAAAVAAGMDVEVSAAVVKATLNGYLALYIPTSVETRRRGCGKEKGLTRRVKRTRSWQPTGRWRSMMP